ncbi:hypothetical protein [Mixta sp.]|uniref:hypothetical protein n=1 Tax=Mixta sp. TaxID=2100765 RepID=UPI0025857BD8|nr:hypothetical protein [Mixta sp.]
MSQKRLSETITTVTVTVTVTVTGTSTSTSMIVSTLPRKALAAGFLFFAHW